MPKFMLVETPATNYLVNLDTISYVASPNTEDGQYGTINFTNPELTINMRVANTKVVMDALMLHNAS